MAQTWHDLLFAHWRVSAAALRPLVPEGLAIDEFDGSAWLAVVPFRMSGVRLRWTLALPWLSVFPELNVRTYVTYKGKPGVWFFSLDAGNPLAVTIIMPPRGPRRVLCVVVVTICTCGTGLG